MAKPTKTIFVTLIMCGMLIPGANTLAGSGDLTLSGDLTVGGSLTVSNVLVSPPPKNILWVSKDGKGHYANINSALASISDNGVNNHYLIKVAPGRYQEKITMKPYVDIEGSGVNQTWVESDGGSGSTNSATVVGCENAELRSLSVGSYAFWATPANTYALGILRNTSGLFLLTDVHITASSASGGDCTGIYIQNGAYYITADRVEIYSNCGNTAMSYGIYTAGNLKLNNSSIHADSTGDKSSIVIKSVGTTVTHDKTEIWNSEIIGSHSGGGIGVARGIENSSGNVTARHSVVKASSAAIYNNGGNTHLAASQLIGTINNISGTLECVYLYDNSFNTLSCP